MVESDDDDFESSSPSRKRRRSSVDESNKRQRIDGTGDDDDDDDDYNDADSMDNVVSEVSNQRLFNIEESDDLDASLSNYTRADWAVLCEQVLSFSIDECSTNREVLSLLNLLSHVFCHQFKDDHEVIDRIHAIYPHVSTMEDQFKRIQQVCGRLHCELERRSMINDDTRDGRSIDKMLTSIAFGVKMTYETLITNRLLQKANDMSMRAQLEKMSPLTFFKSIDLDDLKKHQQLIQYYYRKTFRNQYRKLNSALYKPRYNDNGQFVFAYEYMCEIEEFVHESLFPLQLNAYWFECLTMSGGVAKQCVDVLTKVKCEWLPKLERNQFVFSFQNGIFVTTGNQFYSFTRQSNVPFVGELKSRDLIGINYHDMQFDYEGMQADMNSYTPAHFMGIDIGPITQVLNTQGFQDIDQLWIYGMLGRLLFPIGKMDNWGLHIFFLGLAGTGKSTLLRLTAALLQPNDVGLVNNQTSKLFALESMLGKIFYASLDIGRNFNFDQATWNSMVVGEEVSILRKFKEDIKVEWSCHGGFAGNVLPNWSNDGNSLGRRLFIIEFSKFVTDTDTDLFSKCLAIKDRYLKVIVSAYHALSDRYKGKGIKDHMPKRFKDSEAKILKELDALASFIQEYCEIDRGDPKTFICPWSDLRRHWKGYCKRSGIKMKTLNFNLVNGTFAKYAITTVNPTPNDPHGMTIQYALGMKLKDSASELLDS